MSSFWGYIIGKFVGFLTSPEFFDVVTKSVNILANDPMPGVDKKSLVFDEVETLFKGKTTDWTYSSLTPAINLAIEVAVSFLKTR